MRTQRSWNKDTEIPKYEHRDPGIWKKRSQNMDREIPEYGNRDSNQEVKPCVRLGSGHLKRSVVVKARRA